MTGSAQDRANPLTATGSLLGVLTVVYAALVVTAPVDRFQGLIQKILYVHPACAFAAYLGFLITAICGALYLRTDDERFDRVAHSAAEVGVVFCTLNIVTGPIWAKGTWGTWWSWDPRLTVTLLLWFIYLAYLLLRSFTEGSARTARFASIYGIVGALAIPLNYYAIRLSGGRALHPENLEQGSLGQGMGWPFAAGVATLLVAFLHLLLLRVDLEGLRVRAARRASEADARARPVQTVEADATRGLGYLIAAYAVVAGSLLAYGLQLARERRNLLRESSEDREREAG